MRAARLLLCVAIVCVSACTNTNANDAASTATPIPTISSTDSATVATGPDSRSDTASTARAAAVWEQLPSGPWSTNVVGWTFVAMGNKVLAWGPDGYRVIDVGSQQVRNTTQPPIAPRTGAATVWTGNELVIWGGSEQSGGIATFPALGARYNPSTDTWRSIAHAPIDQRTPAAVAWDGTEMSVWGGRTADPRQLNDSAAYSPGTDTWRRLASLLPQATFESTYPAQGPSPLLWVDVPDPSIPLYGTTNRLYEYDGHRDAWNALAKSPLSGWSPASAATDETFLAIGESSSPGDTNINLDTVSWTASGGWQTLPAPPLAADPVCQTQVVTHGPEIIARRCSTVSVLRGGEWVVLPPVTNSARLLVAGDWLIAIDTTRIDRLALG